MRLLVDECTGSGVAQWLTDQGHDVVSVYDEMRGATDEVVLHRATDEERVLVTNDKDFGEMIYRRGWPHCGVILIRAQDERLSSKTDLIARFLEMDIDARDRFVVVTPVGVRLA